MPNLNDTTAKNVMIVDPSQYFQTENANIFESLGFNVTAKVTNGLDCFQKLQDFQPDLITLDIIMRDMDGIECAKLLEQEFPNIPFIFMTRMTQDKSLIEPLKENYPNWSFLTKPVDLNVLQHHLNTIFPDLSDQETVKPLEFKSLENGSGGPTNIPTPPTQQHIGQALEDAQPEVSPQAQDPLIKKAG